MKYLIKHGVLGSLKKGIFELQIKDYETENGLQAALHYKKIDVAAIILSSLNEIDAGRLLLASTEIENDRLMIKCKKEKYTD